MATISLKYPDAKKDDLEESFAFNFGWDEAMGTKSEFMKKKIVDYVQTVHGEWARQQSQVDKIEIT